MKKVSQCEAAHAGEGYLATVSHTSVDDVHDRGAGHEQQCQRSESKGHKDIHARHRIRLLVSNRLDKVR
jgi:hypothetical protein